MTPYLGAVSINKAAQHAFGVNTDAVVTLQNNIRSVWVLIGLGFSYDAVPTNGVLTVTGGGFNYRWNVTNSGVGFLPIPPGGGGDGEKSDMSSPIIVTLSAGGAGVRGDLDVHATVQ